MSEVGRLGGRTYGSGISNPLSSVSFLASVLVYFVGEFAGRRFGLGPLGSGLPSFVGGVGPGLDWLLGRHDIESRTEAVADESMNVWLCG